jgi:hypothetical protein
MCLAKVFFTDLLIVQYDIFGNLLLEIYIFWNKRNDKGNNKITELRTILQRESQNS